MSYLYMSILYVDRAESKRSTESIQEFDRGGTNPCSSSSNPGIFT
jgi:hypothetical protein